MPAERVGRLILVKTAASASAAAAGVVLYARVSSHDRRSDLDRQVARLTAWATERDLGVGQVVCEVGSGLNGKRPKLRRILSDPDARVIVVEHRDRLARFGVEHLEAALSAQGRRIVNEPVGMAELWRALQCRVDEQRTQPVESGWGRGVLVRGCGHTSYPPACHRRAGLPLGGGAGAKK